jgi:hypothetical protein
MCRISWVGGGGGDGSPGKASLPNKTSPLRAFKYPYVALPCTFLLIKKCISEITALSLRQFCHSVFKGNGSRERPHFFTKINISNSESLLVFYVFRLVFKELSCSPLTPRLGKNILEKYYLLEVDFLQNHI